MTWRTSYGSLPSQFIDTAEPVGEPVGTAVTLHGGWWRDQHGLDLMRPVADHLLARGWRVHNVEYRRTGVPAYRRRRC